jgi:hypothetical protein
MSHAGRLQRLSDRRAIVNREGIPALDHQRGWQEIVEHLEQAIDDIEEKQPLDDTLTALADYNTDGILVQTAADTFAGRTLTAPAAGLTITNPAGIAGNPTFALANDLAALEALSGTSTIYYRSAANTWSAVTIGGNLGFSAGTLGSSLGTAATKNTGTSGNNVPLLDGANTWSGNQTLVIDQNTGTLIRADNANAGTAAFSAFECRNGGLGSTERGFWAVLGTGYTGVTGWQDTAVLSAQNGISNGLVLNSVAAGIKFEVGGNGSTFQVGAITTTGFSCPSATTASAANVHQASSGAALLRVTSGRKYKQAIEDLPEAEADKLLELRPRVYCSKAEADDQTRLHWGFIAEEVAEILPALVGYDEEGLPDWVQYERAVVGLVGLVKREHDARIAIEARLAALENPSLKRHEPHL